MKMNTRMTIRERLANWISGGQFLGAREQANFILRQLGRANEELEDLRAKYRRLHSAHSIETIEKGRESARVLAISDCLTAARAALQEIAEMQTPTANGTVKKMVRRAHEGLKDSNYRLDSLPSPPTMRTISSSLAAEAEKREKEV